MSAVVRASMVAVSSLTACFASAPDDGPECGEAYGRDCPSGQVCVDFQCYPICQTSQDCGPAEACIQSYCQPYAESCGGDGDCAPGWYCAGSACHKAFPLGEPCTADVACGSGHCVDDVCCNEACVGTCRACRGDWTSGDDGICAAVLAVTKNRA